jgi:hypothetical protein
VIRCLATGAVLALFFLFFGFRPFFVPAAALASLHGQVSIESGWWQKHAHGKYFDDALPAPPLYDFCAFGTPKSLLFFFCVAASK